MNLQDGTVITILSDSLLLGSDPYSEKMFYIGTTGALTTLDWIYNTNLSATSRTDLLTKITALNTGSIITTGNLTLDGTLTLENTTTPMEFNNGSGSLILVPSSYPNGGATLTYTGTIIIEGY